MTESPKNPNPSPASGPDTEPSVPGGLSADVEAEKLDRGEGSKDANPGARPGGGKTVEEHLAREKEAQDKSKQ